MKFFLSQIVVTKIVRSETAFGSVHRHERVKHLLGWFSIAAVASLPLPLEVCCYWWCVD